MVKTLANYLVSEAKDKKQLTEDQIYTSRDVLKGFAGKCSKQHNFSDCGLYVMHFTQKFLEELDDILPFLVKVSELLERRLWLKIRLFISTIQDTQPEWTGITKKPVNDRERQAITDRIWDLDAAKERRDELYKEISRASMLWKVQRRDEMAAKEARRELRRQKAQELGLSTDMAAELAKLPDDPDTDDTESENGNSESDIEFVGTKIPQTPSPKKGVRRKKKAIVASSESPNAAGPEGAASVEQDLPSAMAIASPVATRSAPSKQLIEVQVPLLPATSEIRKTIRSSTSKPFKPLFPAKPEDREEGTPADSSYVLTLPLARQSSTSEMGGAPILEPAFKSPSVLREPASIPRSPDFAMSPIEQMENMSLNHGWARSNTKESIGETFNKIDDFSRQQRFPDMAADTTSTDAQASDSDLSVFSADDSFPCKPLPTSSPSIASHPSGRNSLGEDIADLQPNIEIYTAGFLPYTPHLGHSPSSTRSFGPSSVWSKQLSNIPSSPHTSVQEFTRGLDVTALTRSDRKRSRDDSKVARLIDAYEIGGSEHTSKRAKMDSATFATTPHTTPHTPSSTGFDLTTAIAVDDSEDENNPSQTKSQSPKSVTGKAQLENKPEAPSSIQLLASISELPVQSMPKQGIHTRF